MGNKVLITIILTIISANVECGVIPALDLAKELTDLEDVDLEQQLGEYDDYFDKLMAAHQERWEKLKALQVELSKIVANHEAKKEKMDDDYDEYMSDMAVEDPLLKMDDTKDSKEVNMTLATLEDMHRVRERSKKLRLHQILEQIKRLRNGQDSNVSAPHMPNQETLAILLEQNMKSTSEWTSSERVERVQSFYPSCDIPRNTDEEVWSDGTSLNLLFELAYPTSSDGTTVIGITSAKLRLYKLAQGGNDAKNTVDSSSVPPVVNALQPFANFQTNNNQNIDDDRKIRVTVYWYTRSLKKNRVKRKLLDSQMLSIYGEERTEFDIKTAVKAWRESGKNFGLLVTVEDEDGNLLPTHQYIYVNNCTRHLPTSKPLPGILFAAAKDMFLDKSLNNEDENNGTTNENSTQPRPDSLFYPLYPTIDLSTVEVPTSEANNHPNQSTNKKPNPLDFINSNKNFSLILIKNEDLYEMEKDINNQNESKVTEDKKENVYVDPEDESHNLAVNFNRKINRAVFTDNKQSYFQTVSIGQPVYKQKSENNTEKNVQSDSPIEEKKTHQRHPRRKLESIQKEIETKLRETIKDIKLAEQFEKQIKENEKVGLI